MQIKHHKISLVSTQSVFTFDGFGLIKLSAAFFHLWLTHVEMCTQTRRSLSDSQGFGDNIGGSIDSASVAHNQITCRFIAPPTDLFSLTCQIRLEMYICVVKVCF